MLRNGIVASVAVVALAASAFAGTTNLSGTVTTSVPTNFIDTSSTQSANVTGPSDGTFMTILNTTTSASGTWTVSASLGTPGLLPALGLTFYVRTTTGSVTATLNRIQFTDTGSNTATLSSIGFDMTPASANTLTSFTSFSNLAGYTLGGSFVAANATLIQFDIVLTTTGDFKSYQLDAVDISSATPEPATVGLFAVGALGLGCVVRRRARARAARSKS